MCEIAGLVTQCDMVAVTVVGEDKQLILANELSEEAKHKAGDISQSMPRHDSFVTILSQVTDLSKSQRSRPTHDLKIIRQSLDLRILNSIQGYLSKQKKTRP